jgi:hypothetical protein
MLLPADTYLLIFADNETEQGPNHASFSLDAENDELFLSAGIQTEYAIIDSVSFTQLPADTSYGRLPNGYGDFTILPEPSPGAFNASPEIIDSVTFSIILTNNPGTNLSQLIVSLSEAQAVYVSIYTMDGKELYRDNGATLPPGTYAYDIPAANMMSGTYLISVGHGDQETVLQYVVL